MESVSLEDEVRTLLVHPAETTTLDFKETVGWASLRGRIELARDVVCLANRNGGLIVFGVADRGEGRFESVGLRDDDPLPDVTDIGKAIRTYFDPPVPITCVDIVIDGLRYGVVRVAEFSRVPSICKAIGNDETNRAVVRPGYIYRRSDAMECAPIDSAGGVQAIIEAGVAKTGAAVRAMVQGSSDAIPEYAPTLSAKPVASASVPQPEAETLRLCDLIPVDRPDVVPILDIPERISRSAVRSHGGIMVPRSIDPQTLPPSAVVREPGRVLIERSRQDTYSRASSLIEVTNNLRVRIREGLWEEDGALDLTAMFAFTFGCLLFARRFYEGSGVESLDIRIGVTQPLGRRLTDDPSAFMGFFQTYVATSTVDLILSRRVQLAGLADSAIRTDLARDILAEFCGYFGFVLNGQAFEGHVRHIESSIPEIST